MEFQDYKRENWAMRIKVAQKWLQWIYRIYHTVVYIAQVSPNDYSRGLMCCDACNTFSYRWQSRKPACPSTINRGNRIKPLGMNTNQLRLPRGATSSKDAVLCYCVTDLELKHVYIYIYGILSVFFLLSQVFHGFTISLSMIRISSALIKICLEIWTFQEHILQKQPAGPSLAWGHKDGRFFFVRPFLWLFWATFLLPPDVIPFQVALKAL
jgi:hypothetical protein